MAKYTLAQDGDPVTERQRLALLQTCFDPWTIAGLQRLGVASGWRCLDVGAGGGSIALWLADRVGPHGSVTAVDLDLTLLEPLAGPTLSVRRIDVRQEELPQNNDLVHSRLMLEHLPECEIVFQRMIRALRPGGWLVVTDSDFRTVRLSDSIPSFDRVAAAFAPAMQAVGWNSHLGPSLAQMFEQAGLVDVSADSWQTYERGGAHAVLLASTYRRLREPLIAHGIRAADIDDAANHMSAPHVGYFSPTIWTARGRRREG